MKYTIYYNVSWSTANALKTVISLFFWDFCLLQDLGFDIDDVHHTISKFALGEQDESKGGGLQTATLFVYDQHRP